ncbi:crustapain [Dendroctonus ponderosae]|uniref:Cathepsin propeptide inhibitor domain-containing protein n=1 Tax=Dendroctonus ponderosae TaxID=77166 RepID=A0AAR5QC02_DENPD|nr:crustapain [Dendroctonus ponderosae]XP_019770736.1 crustapain [Dendroctonus ponderosae]
MTAPVLLSDQEEWTKFKTGFKKSYEAPDEESRRFEIFQNNLKNIKEHNEKFAKGEVTYTQGVNQFADLTPEEFKNRFTGYRGKPKGSN